ncbi:MAG: hypothetical protein Kow00109_04120 [Acidobacteriota bacterium]
MTVQPPPPRPLALPEYPDLRPAPPARPRLLFLPRTNLPEVTVILGLPRGRAHAPESAPGLVDVCIELLKEGTGRHSSREIAEFLDRYAIQLDQEVELEFSLLAVSCLPSFLDGALDLFAELLFEPTFPERETELLKQRWLSLLLAQRADPGFLAEERIAAERFPSHPYSRISLPPDWLQNVRPAELHEYYGLSFPPADSFFLVAGDFDEKELEARLLQHFEDWAERELSPLPPPPEFPSQPAVHLVHRPASVQAHVAVAFPGIAAADPRRDALELANRALGGGGSARLFLNLRERRGLTYGVYSQLRTHSLTGLWKIQTSVLAERAGEAVREILVEVRRLVEEPPQGEELERCRAELLGGYLRRLESTATLGWLEAVRILKGLPEDYYRGYVERIRSVTTGEIAAAAASLSADLQPLVAVVGDRATLEPQLSDLGPVLVYDTEGRRIA